MRLFQASAFFRAQRRGRWRWPWFLSGILAGPIFGLLLAVFLFLPLGLLGEFGEVEWLQSFFAEFEGDSEFVFSHPAHVALELLMVGIPFWCFAIAGTLIQGRSVRSLVEPLHRFRWGLVGKVLLLEILLQTALIFLPIPFGPAEDPEVRFTGLRLDHLIWTLPILLITLVQTSGEDVYFKGYLLRQFGALTLIAWFAPAIVVAVFVLGHVGNADLEQNTWLFIPAFLIGEVVAIYLLIRTRGMEIPLVLHWVNNTTLFLFYSEAGTQANDLTLWVHERHEDEALALAADIESVIAYGIYLVLLLVALLWRRSPFYVGDPPEIPPVPSPPPSPPVPSHLEPA